MEAVASGLCERGVATLRYQFPYMEKGSKRPDPPAIAHRAVRAAVAEAARCCSGLPLIAGGKSFGGRMTSQAQAAAPLAGVRGLAFLGFPLHPAGKPSSDRARHLAEVHIPMLFVQGTRDALAEVALLEPLVQSLGRSATLHLVDGADHSFHVLARSGRNDREVLNEILDAFAGWVDAVIAS
jgi:predicted alpha/beta-hydrolase family hydrolase